MQKRSLVRAFSATVITVVVGAGLAIGWATAAQAKAAPPEDKDLKAAHNGRRTVRLPGSAR